MKRIMGWKRQGGQTSEGHSSEWSLLNEWEGLEDLGRRVAGTGRKATGFRDRDWREEEQEEDDGWPRQRSKGPERESVYRLWCMNSRAVSKSPRSAESLWIGAKKIHWPTVSRLWCRREKLAMNHEVVFCSPCRDKAGITPCPPFILKEIRLHELHKGV